VIAGLTLSSRRRRIGLYFAIHEHNVKTPQVEAFIRRVQRQVGKPLIVVMDRLAAHRSAARKLERDKRFSMEWLPGYAPDLNPVEGLWSKTKYGDLANYVPEDVLDLEIEAELALEILLDRRGDRPVRRPERIALDLAHQYERHEDDEQDHGDRPEDAANDECRHQA